MVISKTNAKRKLIHDLEYYYCNIQDIVKTIENVINLKDLYKQERDQTLQLIFSKFSNNNLYQQRFLLDNLILLYLNEDNEKHYQKRINYLLDNRKELNLKLGDFFVIYSKYRTKKLTKYIKENINKLQTNYVNTYLPSLDAISGFNTNYEEFLHDLNLTTTSYNILKNKFVEEKVDNSIFNKDILDTLKQTKPLTLKKQKQNLNKITKLFTKEYFVFADNGTSKINELLKQVVFILSNKEDKIEYLTSKKYDKFSILDRDFIDKLFYNFTKYPDLYIYFNFEKILSMTQNRTNNEDIIIFKNDKAFETYQEICKLKPNIKEQIYVVNLTTNNKIPLQIQNDNNINYINVCNNNLIEVLNKGLHSNKDLYEDLINNSNKYIKKLLKI